MIPLWRPDRSAAMRRYAAQIGSSVFYRSGSALSRDPGAVTRRPLIGVSASLHDFGDYGGVGVQRPLLLAGALPLTLPQLPDAIEPTLDRLDGIVLAPGRDIEPSRYGQDAHPLRRPPLGPASVASPMARPIVLGVVGDSGSGKTTLTRGLIRVLGAEHATRAQRRRLPPLRPSPALGARGHAAAPGLQSPRHPHPAPRPPATGRGRSEAGL